jgi:ubiquinone/menaquinone biosynthesis C-methylase UbiE
MTEQDRTRARFARSAARLAALGDARLLAVRERMRGLLPLTGDERAIDVGAGTGPLAFALAPLVREVVALDLVPEMLAEGRRHAREFPNVLFVEGDALALPYAAGVFDLALSGRTLHHVERPGGVVAELARVTRAGGLVLVVDQIAPADPQEAELLERIERLRDASHARSLPDAELRALLSAVGLELTRVEQALEERDLDEFLALAGCEGEGRDRVVAVVEEGLAAGRGASTELRRAGTGYTFRQAVGWYLARKPA